MLIECTLEAFAAGLVVGIQDLGGAGLSCATSELASAGDGGMHVVLDAVPLRAEGMTAAEILSSESQERMCAVVTPDRVDEFLAVCAKWEVEADVIGEVTDTGRLVVEFHGEVVVDVPPRTVAHEGPVYRRPLARPARRMPCRPTPPRRCRARGRASWATLVLRMAASPNLCSRAWVTDQYDRYVRGNTVLAQPADAGIVRVAENSPSAAVSTGPSAASRWPATATAGTPCWTRTPARSSRSPRPTATSPPPAPFRSR